MVGAANKYLSDTEPWKLKDDPARRDTVLHTALQVVQDCNTLLTPFLPHAAQKVYEALGGTGVWAAQPEIRHGVGGRRRPTTRCCMGDYASQQAARWESRPDPAGARPPSRPRCSPSWTRTGAGGGERKNTRGAGRSR